jgi:hypothetical protein
MCIIIIIIVASMSSLPPPPPSFAILDQMKLVIDIIRQNPTMVSKAFPDIFKVFVYI